MKSSRAHAPGVATSGMRRYIATVARWLVGTDIYRGRHRQ